jgi:ketosteroid isomerase-like protein
VTAPAPPSVDLARRWLTALAEADYAAWPSLVADDVRMSFPFAPPGIPDRCDGGAACQTAIRTFFAGIASFVWQDLQLFPARDRAVVFATGRSEVVLRTGKPYRNEYCFMMRFRDGKLSEYREYFNPLPAIAAFTPKRHTDSTPGSRG